MPDPAYFTVFVFRVLKWGKSGVNSHHFFCATSPVPFFKICPTLPRATFYSLYQWRKGRVAQGGSGEKGGSSAQLCHCVHLRQKIERKLFRINLYKNWYVCVKNMAKLFYFRSCSKKCSFLCKISNQMQKCKFFCVQMGYFL